MKEVWKKSAIYPESYIVSNMGRVKSVDRFVKCGYGTIRRIRGKEIKPRDNHGYDFITITSCNKRRHIFVHRLVAMTFIPRIEGKVFCNHLDGNKRNNHVDNLEWCNRSENMTHAYANNLVPKRDRRGENSIRTKLKNSDIIEIRDKYAKGIKVSKIAMEYGLKKPAIYNIISGRSWGHINHLLT